MIHRFESPGYIYGHVPMAVYNSLLDIVSIAKERKESYAYSLAGQIAQEYTIPLDLVPKAFKDHVTSQVHVYLKEFPFYLNRYMVNTSDSKIVLNTLWCNIQKKYEYNPVHIHDGLFSFVYWVKIPYNIQDELSHESRVNSNSPLPAAFQMHYNDAIGNIHNLPFSPNEGDFVFFPANLSHSVDPFFTSDKERISISGNFYYKTD